MRAQYHLRRTARGIDAFDVARLIEASKDFDSFAIDPHSIKEIHENHWFFQNTSEPTPLSILEHFTLIDECDTSYPIILDASGRLMDGMHRVCKAILDKSDSILAVQFESDPEPDYRDCDPARLPYGD